MKLAGLAVSLGPSPRYSLLSKRRMKVTLCMIDMILSFIVIAKSVSANIGVRDVIKQLNVLNISYCVAIVLIYITSHGLPSNHITSPHLAALHCPSPHHTLQHSP
jgi:hypothetical protein